MSLAALIVRRLTHDFAGPVGAIGTAVEMDPGGDPELLALIADGAAGLGATLKLYRFVATPDDGEVASGAVRALVADWLALKGSIALDWPDNGVWPAAVARLTAGLAMVAADTRSRKIGVALGKVTIDAALDADIATVLEGETPTTTRHAVAALLAVQAAEAGLAMRVDGFELAIYQASA